MESMRLRRMLLTIGFTLLVGAPGFAGANAAAKTAKREYDHARELMQKGQLEAAIPHARTAAEADPLDIRYVSYAELLKQIRSSRKLTDAEALQRSGAQAQAMEVLRDALKSDPDNPELIAARSEVAQGSLPVLAKMRVEPGPPQSANAALAPSGAEQKRTFHMRGPSTQVLRDFFQQYGITVVIHPSVATKQIRFDMEDAGYTAAQDVLLRVTRTFLVPASATEGVLYGDTSQNRREYEHLYVQSFDVLDAGKTEEINELTNVLRSMFGFSSVGVSAQGRIVIKGSRTQVDAAARFIADVVHPSAEALIEVNAYEVSGTFMRNLGLNIPLQYQVFNVNTVLQQLQSQSPSQLANQLSSTGSLGQGTLAALGGLLSGAAGSSLAALLNQPIATFGGGNTKEAAVLPPVQLNLTDEHDSFRTLRQVLLRAGNGVQASYHDGIRYPIVTTQFSPLLNSSVLSQLGQNFTPPFPGVQYEDLGVTLKVTPSIQSDKSMVLKFELQIRQLAAQAINGIPVISNREFTGSVNMKQGETALLAGFMQSSDIRDRSGLPGLGVVSALAPLGGNYNRNRQETELLITVTPRAVRLPIEEGVAFPLSTVAR